MIITIAHIQARKDLTQNMKAQRHEQHIRDAELSDLKPILGEKFYNDVVANKDSESYKVLLDGGTYDYDGFTYRIEGLRAVLVEFAYARIMMFGSFASTGFGMVEKTYKDGANAERAARKEIYKAAQQTAMALWSDVKAYLDRVDAFEYWGDSETNVPFGAFKLRHIR